MQGGSECKLHSFATLKQAGLTDLFSFCSRRMETGGVPYKWTLERNPYTLLGYANGSLIFTDDLKRRYGCL
jgi:hypothetical protein